MLKAARLGDQISHTQQRSGLITGMIVGALLVGAVVLAVASGGTAIPVLLAVGAVATGAAVGGGIGQMIGGEMTVPKGVINKAATTVFINSRATPAARACVDTALCQDHVLQLIATGSTTVAIEGFPAARVSDIGACSFAISQGSCNVFIGGAQGACAGIDISPEVEPWLSNLHLAVGLIGSFCLGYGALGWAGSALSTAMGFGGSLVGSELGGKYFGKWGAIGGGILGGILGGGLGAGMSRGLGNVGIRGFNPTNNGRVLLARQRQEQMLRQNEGYNVSPTSWDSYPTIGRNGSYITDSRGITDVLGRMPNSPTTNISAQRAASLERSMGLEPGSLADGFKIRRVTDINGMAPRSPLEGNSFFRGPGQHLPGGAPEVVVNSIPTTSTGNVTTITEVFIRK